MVVAVGLGAFVLLELVFCQPAHAGARHRPLKKTSPTLVDGAQGGIRLGFRAASLKATLESESELTGDRAVVRFLDHQTRPITERYGDVGRRAPAPLLKDWLEKLATTMD